jgi:hypothetical protein
VYSRLVEKPDEPDSFGRRRGVRRWILLAVAAVLIALAARYGVVPPPTDGLNNVEALMAIAPVHLQQSVPGVELIDLEVLTGSDAKVSYEHDQLFDVVFTYRRDDELRTITAPYGLKDGSWITPTKVEMVARDESALLVR